MNLAKLFIRMVRWRVAMTLVIFTLVGAAWFNGLQHISYLMLAAIVGIAASYACATCVNDLADFEIDKINLPKDKDRPLVGGKAKKRDLIITAVLAGVIAVVCGIAIGKMGIVIIVASLLINLFYSLPPIQISHRTLLAPAYLPLGYVVIPFLMGMLTVRASFRSEDLYILAGLYLLFLGRIILKDFRDRVGDAKNGKQTFLLRFGKQSTVTTSTIAVILGYALLIRALLPKIGPSSLLIVLFMISNLTMLWRLSKVAPGEDEQMSIGVGAKMGNGMLLTVLAFLILQRQTVQASTILLAGIFLIILYGYNFIMFLLHPEQSVIAYKK